MGETSFLLEARIVGLVPLQVARSGEGNGTNIAHEGPRFGVLPHMVLHQERGVLGLAADAATQFLALAASARVRDG